jgi:hypothetical protein
MKVIPQDLDWVKARAACTAECLFPQLAKDIHSDVKARNSVDSSKQFAAELLTDRRTLIVGEIGTWARREKIRIFHLSGRIEVRDETNGTASSAAVILNDEGRCMFRLDDSSELEQWQFRKKTLEGLLFGD